MSVYGNSTADRVKTVIDTMKMRIGSMQVSNRGFTCKVFSVDDQDRIQIIYHSFEKNPAQKDFAVREATKFFKDSLEKLKEEYEMAFGEELTLKNTSPIQDFSDAIGASYSTTFGGAFMGNAEQVSRSYLLRLAQDFEASVPSDKEDKED